MAVIKQKRCFWRGRPAMRLPSRAVFGFALAVFPAACSASSDCTLAQLLADPGATVGSCTLFVNTVGLVQSRRAEALFLRGQAYHRTRRLTEADADYAAATAITPRNEDIWVAWANLDLRRGNTQGFVEKVQKAASLNEHSGRVLRTIGLMFRVYGDNDKALIFYSKALEADPTEPFALLSRSRIYLEKGKFAEALADADALVALPSDVINHDGYLDPDGNVRDFHVAALIERAKLYEDVRQIDLAARDYAAAVSAGRTVPALVAHADFLVREKSFEKALALLEEATKSERLNTPAQFALGLELIRAQRFESAMAAFDSVIEARPGFAGAYKMRARVHRQLGHTDEAVRDFIRAINANPAILNESIPAFRLAGYWMSPETPRKLTPELEDAIRACMLDTKCN